MIRLFSINFNWNSGSLFRYSPINPSQLPLKLWFSLPVFPYQSVSASIETLVLSSGIPLSIRLSFHWNSGSLFRYSPINPSQLPLKLWFSLPVFPYQSVSTSIETLVLSSGIPLSICLSFHWNSGSLFRYSPINLSQLPLKLGFSLPVFPYQSVSASIETLVLSSGIPLSICLSFHWNSGSLFRYSPINLSQLPLKLWFSLPVFPYQSVSASIETRVLSSGIPLSIRLSFHWNSGSLFRYSPINPSQLPLKLGFSLPVFPYQSVSASIETLVLSSGIPLSICLSFHWNSGSLFRYSPINLSQLPLKLWFSLPVFPYQSVSVAVNISYSNIK